MSKLNIYHRRDGRWEGRISRGKKENGKRKYQYVIARTRDVVVEKMEDIRRSEQPKGRCSKTVSVLFSEWYCSIQHRVKESTVANYTMKAQKHILPNFGDKSVDSIVQNDIYSFIEAKQKEGLSNRYVSDIIILMKTIYKYAVRIYHIFNPMDGIVLPKKKSSEIDLLDESEQAKLQNYINNNQNYSTLGVALSMSTGIRIGELCALQWKDIDLEKRILTVRKTMQRIQCPTEISKTKLIITDPKSESSRRRIPIPDCMVGYLNKFKEKSDKYVLTGSNKPVEPRTVQYRFKAVLKACHVRNIPFHLLRHTYATVCIANGFDPKTLSELLGHADASITLNRYVHSSMHMKQQYVSRLCLSA